MTRDAAADLKDAAVAALRCSFDHSIEHPSKWRDLSDRLEVLADIRPAEEALIDAALAWVQTQGMVAKAEHFDDGRPCPTCDLQIAAIAYREARDE